VESYIADLEKIRPQTKTSSGSTAIEVDPSQSRWIPPPEEIKKTTNEDKQPEHY
jgi:hypothetical protein